MPYIKQSSRILYDTSIDDLCESLQKTNYPCGDVTYILYKIVIRMFENDTRYQTIADIRAALVGTLSEFDRRFAFPYEDEKIKENGDVDLEESVGLLTVCSTPGCNTFSCEYHNEDE